MQGWDRRFFSQKTWGVYHFPRHWTLWNPKTITRMLNNVGFEVIHISTPAAAVVWTWSVNHALQSRNFPKWMVNFFSLNNPLVLAAFWLVEIIPSLMRHSAGMSVIAQRKT